MKILILAVVFMCVAVTVSAQTKEEKTKAAIRKVLDEQTAAWNRGDIEAFMQGYWNSPQLMFVSGDTVTRGWQPTLERYRKSYDTREKMGTLGFSELEIMPTGKDSAVVFGRFTLERKNDKPTGLFTLTFRRFKEGWKIILDHTS